MKVLKGILIALLVLVALILLVAVFLPSSFSVTRSIEIQKPVDVIFAETVDLNNRTNWDPWLAEEPSAKTTISGPGNEVGSTWSWEGEVIGSGSMTMEKIVENELIQSSLIFTAPQSSEATVLWKFDAIDTTSTTITWNISGELSYPVERYFGLMMDGMVGSQFEKGLLNLKTYIEQK